MMLHILRDKFIRLGRDEEGVAMVVTLAIFMFMYLICMGVYAIGTAVKTRIHLQNACDAAAYSAAVVQADTLSRIATLNRAMSWTYVQMSRRQMDYIVDRWLTKTVQKVQGDVATAKSTGSPGSHFHNYWTLRPYFPTFYRCGVFDDEDHSSVKVSLNGTHTPNVGPRYQSRTIKYELATFEDRWFWDSSFYKGGGAGISVMQRQIAADKETVREMFNAEEKLAQELPRKIEDAVNDVLAANVLPDVEWQHKVFHSSSPYAAGGSADSYLDVLANSKEKRFLSFANYHPSNASKPFDKGSGRSQWFPLSGGDGFCRKYRQTRTLRSSWAWRSWRWICTSDGCAPMPSGFGSGSCLGSECYDSYFDGEAAKPLVLTEAYFNKNGTITVGLAVENRNPWTPILGAAIRGVFSAFNIGGAVFPLYTVCFASAKTGYKETARLNWGNTRALETGDRAYRVDWEDGDWNLCQSDLDAVLIPVRRAESPASNGSWSDGNLNFLDDYANKLGVDSTKMRAGGDGLDIDSFYGSRNLSEEYRFGNSSGFWGGADLPIKQEAGDVKAKWQIGSPNQQIKWDDLQKVMFH